MNTDALRELLQSPLDDVAAYRRFRLRLVWFRNAGLAILIGFGLVIFSRWAGTGTSADVRAIAHPAFSVRVRVPPLDSFAMTADPTTGRIVAFGGRSLVGSGFADGLNDQTWQFADGSWWWLRGRGPEPRLGHELSFDTQAGVAVLFGGSTTKYEPCFVVEWCGADAYADTWTLRPFIGRWALVEPEVAPPPRFGHAMAYDESTGTVVLFGGGQPNEGRGLALADTWVYDVASATWTEVATPAAPLPRAHHTMVTDPAGGVLLFGGTGPGIESMELWRFADSTWRQITLDTAAGSRSMTAMVALDDATLRIIGGTGEALTDQASDFLDEIVTIDMATGHVELVGAIDEPVWRHEAVVHPISGDVYVLVRGRTLVLDPTTNAWEDISAALDEAAD